METNCINNEVLGFFDGKVLNQSKEPMTPQQVAMHILAKVVRNDGFKFNDKGRNDWMNDTKDYYLNELETVVDNEYIIETLFNDVHIIGLDRKQVSKKVEQECVKYLLTLFE